MEDLIYSVPHKEMFVAVRECSENYGQVLFQSRAGISVEDIMSLLELYLSATVFFFLFGGKLYVQKRGICIGSCVAPMSCDIFSSLINRRLARVFGQDKVLKVCRYVDDF